MKLTDKELVLDWIAGLSQFNMIAIGASPLGLAKYIYIIIQIQILNYYVKSLFQAKYFLPDLIYCTGITIYL